jgi:CubicO group peptidase (beta-lactamase class C family)
VDAFQRIVSEWRQAWEVPSVSVAVFRRGAVLHAGSFGEGRTGGLYQTGSLGKHFTAALALLLAAEGTSLDTPVPAELPELPPSWSGVTLRQLLSHTAGVGDAGYDALDPTRDYSDSQIVQAIVAGGGLGFAPGSAWSYSNSGYVLAGIAIGRRSGAFYGDLLRERIFLPLGMTTAATNGSDPPLGYVREDRVLTRAAYVSPTLNRLADGGITATLDDFIRWEAALWGEWGVRVSEMFVESRLTTGRPCGYGLGWSLRNSERGRIADHDGLWQGFRTAMVRCLDEGVSSIVLANFDEADAADLAGKLIALGQNHTASGNSI